MNSPLTFDQRLEIAINWMDAHETRIAIANQRGILAASVLTDAAVKLTGCYTESNLTALENAISEFETVIRLIGEATHE